MLEITSLVARAETFFDYNLDWSWNIFSLYIIRLTLI